MVEQSKALGINPHAIIASPGRINDSINVIFSEFFDIPNQNTSGLKSQLKIVQVLVLNEADRLLSLDFDEELYVILNNFQRKNRPQTYRFSAVPLFQFVFHFSQTMTQNIEKLDRVAMSNAVTVQVADLNSTPENLVQWMKFIPTDEKLNLLAALVAKKKNESMIILCNTAQNVVESEAFLDEMNHQVNCVYGKFKQQDRLKNISKFTSNKKKIQVTTEVTSRGTYYPFYQNQQRKRPLLILIGIDIPNVDFVIDYDCLYSHKDYMHSVGRTVRAGKHGETLLLVTQYDLGVVYCP